MIKKILALLFFLVILFGKVAAQNQLDSVSNILLVASYILNEEDNKVIRVANNILKKDKNTYTTEDSIIISWAAAVYQKRGDILTARKLAVFSTNGLLPNIDKEMTFFNNQIVVDLFRHEGTNSTVRGNLEDIVTTTIPELIELAKNKINTTNPRQSSVYDSIYTVLSQYKSAIGLIPIIEQIRREEKGLQSDVNKYVMNYFLQVNELGCYIRGMEAGKDFGNINCDNIRTSLYSEPYLGKKDVAIMMFSTNLLGVDFIGSIAIAPDWKTPRLVYFEGKNKFSSTEMVHKLKKLFPIADIYIQPSDDMLNVDIAYCDNRIHIKRNLADMARVNKDKGKNYSGGKIHLMADINYGINPSGRNNVVPLQDGAILISELQKLYGEKLYTLRGDNVRKVNFYNITDDVEILHISTHGELLESLKPATDIQSFYSQYMGYSLMDNQVLALSGYNESKEENCISAYDILGADLTDCTLVFLDACSSGKTKEKAFNVSSLANSFYCAGSQYVIAYNHEVLEKIATDFALEFYRELKTSFTKDFHNVFYDVKERVIEKYKTVLTVDKSNNYDFGIILWE